MFGESFTPRHQWPGVTYDGSHSRLWHRQRFRACDKHHEAAPTAMIMAQAENCLTERGYGPVHLYFPEVDPWSVQYQIYYDKELRWFSQFSRSSFEQWPLSQQGYPWSQLERAVAIVSTRISLVAAWTSSGYCLNKDILGRSLNEQWPLSQQGYPWCLKFKFNARIQRMRVYIFDGIRSCKNLEHSPVMSQDLLGEHVASSLVPRLTSLKYENEAI